MRKKIDFRTGSKETYKNFCTTYPDIHLKFDEWHSIIYMYSKLVREYIIETGRIFKFPRGVGEFAINRTRPPKSITVNGEERITLPINWKRSKEKGKRIYEMNYHTEGYKCSWLWINKQKAMIYMSSLWKFKPHRDSKRLLASYLKSGKGYHNRYCEWKK